jgi:hypothetical protein
MKTVEYEYHPYADLFPLMGGDELAALAADIAANGLREKIVRHEGKVLDGRNRLRACELADVDPRFADYEGDDPLGFVVSKNLHRRHLTESQRAMVAGRLANLQAPKSGTRKAVTAAAESLSVSPRSVDAARKVEADGVPELADAVEKGEVSVSAAAEVAKLPKADQRKAVRSGLGAIKDAAKKAKAPPVSEELVGKVAAALRKNPAATDHDLTTLTGCTPAEAKAARKAAKKLTAGDEPEPEAGPEEHPAEPTIRRLNVLCRRLDECKAEAEQIAADPFGRHVHLESVAASIDAARKALWQSRPTEPCARTPECGSGGGACKACYGTGRTTAARALRGAKA